MEKARRLLLLVVALAVVASPAHAQKGKGKPGGEDTTNLLQVEFSNRTGDRVTGVAAYPNVEEYLDSRAGGDVEAFLYPSGSPTLRLEETGRVVGLNLGDGAPPELDTGYFEVSIRELNSSKHTPPDDADVLACEEAVQGGDVNLQNRGILCIPPGRSMDATVSIWWDDADSNRRFQLRWRDDENQPGAPNNALISRCKVEPTAQDPVPNAPACSARGIEDELAWVFSTAAPASPDDPPDTGPWASLLSNTIKGRPDTQFHGFFEMPFEFVVTCVADTCPAYVAP